LVFYQLLSPLFFFGLEVELSEDLSPFFFGVRASPVIWLSNAFVAYLSSESDAHLLYAATPAPSLPPSSTPERSSALPFSVVPPLRPSLFQTDPALTTPQPFFSENSLSPSIQFTNRLTLNAYFPPHVTQLELCRLSPPPYAERFTGSHLFTFSPSLHSCRQMRLPLGQTSRGEHAHLSTSSSALSDPRRPSASSPPFRTTLRGPVSLLKSHSPH